MNGATPSGPIAWVTRRASERTAACAGTGRREKRAMIVSGKRWGRYCDPMPTAIAARTAPVTSGLGSPHAVKSRSITSQASANESARKKIHAKQTTWNVAKRGQPRRHGVEGRSTKAGPLAPPALGDERGTVDGAPGDERPARAVPEAAEQHRQHQVAVREEPA